MPNPTKQLTIEIITSITNAKDELVEYLNKGSVIYTAFMDSPTSSNTWNIKNAYDRFKDPRRNSRIHKILIHKYSTADITIWMDGNKYLLTTPEEMVEKYLNGYDMAIFSHSQRDCIYDEAMVVAKLKLDDPEVIIEQAKYYEDNDFAKHKGLCEGGFIIRRNNHRTRTFNEAWWADYCRFSRRDQLSLMPAIEQSGVNVNIIYAPFRRQSDNSYVRDGGSMSIVGHLHAEGNHNQ